MLSSRIEIETESELFDRIYNIQQNSLLASERELHGERSSNIHPREQVRRFIYGIFLAGNCPAFFIAATLLQQYGKQVTLNGTRYWLDSKTEICWIQNRGEWKQFVRHRVNEIHKLSAKDEWRHCPGEDNLADTGSRGVLASKLKDEELWWKGPPWLTQEESSWPTSQVVTSTPESQEEMKKTSTVMIVDVQDSASVAKVVDSARHGTLTKLLRVTALMLLFVQNSKPRCAKRKGRLTREELINAENEWLKAAQPDLKRQKNVPNLEILLGLETVGGVLRCFGRLEHSDLEVEAQKLIILPKDHAYTTKTIEECHERVFQLVFHYQLV